MRYVRGWYAERGGLVYVNRGIGVTGVPIRFCSRPEISLFTLRPAPPGQERVTRRVVA
jgi:predicted MPP superfamily phosphohydrolase